LASGRSASLRATAAVAGWQGASFGDILIEQRQIWDETGWQVISPISYAAQGEFSWSDSFAFGIATSTPMEAIVNGEAEMVDGPTVWTTPFSTEGFPRGESTGRVVGVGDWRHIEAAQGSLWIETDRVVNSYHVPPDVKETRLRGANFGAIGEVEIWNWSAGAFDSAEVGEVFDSATYRSASGEVIVRLHGAANGEPPYPQNVIVEWERA
jgi:hypothetical protein